MPPIDIKQIITVGVAGVAMGALALDNVEVTDVKARQRYPWNGKVDIDFTLGTKPTGVYRMKIEVVDNDGKTNLPVRTVCAPGVSVAENPCVARVDTSRVVWDAAADLPNGFKCTNVLVTARVSADEGENLYCVVNLSDGSKQYLNAVPAGGWTDVYKKDKMVFRRVDAGSFMMGSPETEPCRRSNETQHKVTLTKPYYIGIFEVTESQYAKVTGGSSASTMPQFLEYNDLETFRQKMTNATKIVGLNLPTEAQWEMACRAGTTTGLNNGYEADEEYLSQIARHDGNVSDGRGNASSTGPTYVGCYQPNAFGLYDMIGNAQEWCCDGWVDELGIGDVTDPIGDSTSTSQSARGGGFIAGRAYYSYSGSGAPYTKYVPCDVKLYWVSNAELQSCRGGYRLGVAKNGIALMKTVWHEMLMKKVAFENYSSDSTQQTSWQARLVAGYGSVYEMNGMRFAWVVE